ncbi:MAG: SDR family oxidoreductase [Candidatus Omnitrophica bacterium]|nr:SDR family oxidoreductase [Candidatus Omnitrophota bacterium]
MNVLDLFRLTGQVAIVTGGAQNLGRQHALALAEAGADVAICDLLPEAGKQTCREIEALGRHAFFGQVDVTQTDQIDAFLEAAIKQLGPIDILVNNAAMPSEGCALETVDDNLWRKIIDTNLSSIFYFSKRVARHMIATKRPGRIINIASVNAVIISNILPRHNIAYCTAKAGVAHLTRGMAAEWAPYRIRVNAVAPGYIHTAQTAASAKYPEIVERITSNTPMKRYGRIDELKGAIVFLASEASSYATGSMVTVDGGHTIW